VALFGGRVQDLDRDRLVELADLRVRPDRHALSAAGIRKSTALSCWRRWARVAPQVTADLLADLGRLPAREAVDFLIPAAEKGVSVWPYPQISELDQSISIEILHAAAEQGHDKKAAAAIPLVPKPPIGDMWPIRPSALCLDNPLK